MQTSVVHFLDSSAPLAAAVYTSKAASREVARSVPNSRIKSVRKDVKQSEKKLPLPLNTPLAALAALLSFPAHAVAQSYDELVGKIDSAATDVPTFAPSFDLDLSGIDLSGIDPTLVAGGVAAVLLPASLFAILGSKGYAGDVSAADAFSLLQQGGGVLLDVRTKNDRKESGSPSLKPLKLKAVSVPFEVEDGELLTVDGEFAQKVLALKGITSGSEVVVLDKFGQVSPNAAKILTKSGFSKVYAVKGGADGTNGWKESELPWDEPGGFKFDLSSFSGLSEAFSASTEDKGSLIVAGVGLLAAAGFSAVIVTEAEVLLQLLGSVALIQVALKKLLFAKDRKKTLAEVRAFVDNQVAPSSLLQDIKEIGSALLPDLQRVSGAVAAAVEKVEEALPATSTISNALEGAAEASASVTDKAVATVAPQTSPAPKRASSTDFPPPPRPLSPYASYPELKPPTSPMPKANKPAPDPVVPTSSTDFPPPPRPLSPYASYPDLKPPSSPTPKRPVTLPAPPAPAPDPVAPQKSAAPSTDFPPPPQPLSPYALYPDLKPPATPTPSPP